MKLKSFIFFLFLPLLTLAQTLEYEVIRTQESPGFFAVRLFAGEDLEPEYIEDVFVINFEEKSEKKIFEPLIKSLKNSGIQVLKKEEIREYLFNKKYRVIILGGKTIKDFPQFRASPNEDINESFEKFTQNYLGPIYLKNITANFGGNVSEVLPSKVPYLNDKATFFIGKFEQPINTRMSINATNQENEFDADFPINLENYKKHKLDELLPSLWEKVNKKTSSKAFKRTSSKWLLNAFPIILVIIGVFFIYISFRSSSRKKRTNEDLIDDKFWNTPIEETPLYKNWEENLPFEVKGEK